MSLSKLIVQNNVMFENDCFIQTEQATIKEQGLILCVANVYKALPQKTCKSLSQIVKQGHLAG